LSELKSEFHNRYARLSEQLKELEKINCFNEVDSIIMEKEISKAISHLKSNKSPGGYSPVIIWIRWSIAFMYCC
jgi:cell fate (sporulation/competence/biofilm development) regulator YmcA (YheA/YmcA/DUF963 family)